MNIGIFSFLFVSCFLGIFAAVLKEDNDAVFSVGDLIFHPDRIVGGVDAQKAEFPSLIDIRMRSFTGKSYHACGGTIVNERWIVTAAHCSQRSNDSYTLVAGAHDFTKPSGNEQTVKVVKIIVHPEYVASTVNNDIALMKIDPPFKFTEDISPVNLAETNFEPADTATVTGWGTLKSGGGLPDILQKVEVPHVADDICIKDYENINKIVKTMVCYGQKGKDSCQGDSGGPLFVYYDSKCYLFGVVSWGYGCAQEKYPGVYTRVPEFYDWILSTISSDS